MSEQNVHIVITSPLDDRALAQIGAVSPRVRVDMVSAWVVAEKKGDLSRQDELNRRLAEADVIYGWIHQFPKELQTRIGRLKWLQVMTAGVDRLPEAILKSGIRVANASGLHGTAMGEVVLEMMLMFVKDAAACMRMKQQREWRRYRPAILRGKTVGILGLGAVGREIARLCKAFGMEVVGMRRSAPQGEALADVDRVYPREALTALLAESDFVVLALPLTKETEGMIGEAELRAMKPTAFLINVARGAVVDEQALISALAEKRIAGAGLDVFSREPLPPESPFYTLENVIFSPHISGDIPDYEARATEVFCENLRRYLAGEPFLHEVDPEKGY